MMQLAFVIKPIVKVRKIVKAAGCGTEQEISDVQSNEKMIVTCSTIKSLRELTPCVRAILSLSSSR